MMDHESISTKIEVFALVECDRPWAARILEENWGSTTIVTRGRAHDTAKLPGFVAWQEGQRPGLLSYRSSGDECEIISLNSLAPGQGIGSSLLSAVKERATELQCLRLWLITTNDNTPALRFYQKRGYRLVTVYRDALVTTRALKPGLSHIGLDGIPMHDEIELELIL
jgi:ribosomal protein S18 acetylase RimI-like enzyme